VTTPYPIPELARKGTRERLTPEAVQEVSEVDGDQDHEEDHEEPVVVVADAGREPHAVMVETRAACMAQLTVLGAIRNHDLEERNKSNTQDKQ